MLILDPKAGGTGQTLTAAPRVIHLSRCWNPAAEKQCNDRVHRIGQARPVSVHIPMALHPEPGAQSVDCLLQSPMKRKRKLAEQALWPMGDGVQPPHAPIGGSKFLREKCQMRAASHLLDVRPAQAQHIADGQHRRNAPALHDPSDR